MTSAVVILGESGDSGTSTTAHDNFRPFKTFGVNRGGLWAWPKS